MEYKYYMLSVDRLTKINSMQKTIFYYGNLSRFLLIEKELGYDTVILWSMQITQEEYDYAISEIESKGKGLFDNTLNDI